jgi:hypothetical protein
VNDDEKRDRDARLMKYAAPVLEELLSMRNSIMATIEYKAGIVRSAPEINSSDAIRFVSLVRDYDRAMIGEMIRAMPDTPISSSTPIKPPKHHKPHPWRSKFKMPRKG